MDPRTEVFHGIAVLGKDCCEVSFGQHLLASPYPSPWPALAPHGGEAALWRCGAEEKSSLQPDPSSLPAFALFIIGHRWQQTSRSIPLCWLAAAGSCRSRGTSQGNSSIPLLYQHGPFCKGREEQRCRSPACSHPGISSRAGLVATNKQALDLLQAPMLQGAGMNWGTVEGARAGETLSIAHPEWSWR